MQLTCGGTNLSFSKIRLQISLLNYDYTLRVVQHCNEWLHCNDVCVCFYYTKNARLQTATLQTMGLRSVHLYVHNT